MQTMATPMKKGHVEDIEPQWGLLNSDSKLVIFGYGKITCREDVNGKIFKLEVADDEMDIVNAELNISYMSNTHLEQCIEYLEVFSKHDIDNKQESIRTELVMFLKNKYYIPLDMPRETLVEHLKEPKRKSSSLNSSVRVKRDGYFLYDP